MVVSNTCPACHKASTSRPAALFEATYKARKCRKWLEEGNVLPVSAEAADDLDPLDRVAGPTSSWVQIKGLEYKFGADPLIPK